MTAIFSVAVAVIVLLALQQRSREQWREQAKLTQEVLLSPSPNTRSVDDIPTKLVSLEEMWTQESRPGSAYWELPDVRTEGLRPLLGAEAADLGEPVLEEIAEEEHAGAAAGHVRFKPTIAFLPPAEDDDHDTPGRSIA